MKDLVIIGEKEIYKINIICDILDRNCWDIKLKPFISEKEFKKIIDSINDFTPNWEKKYSYYCLIAGLSVLGVISIVFILSCVSSTVSDFLESLSFIVLYIFSTILLVSYIVFSIIFHLIGVHQKLKFHAKLVDHYKNYGMEMVFNYYSYTDCENKIVKVTLLSMIYPKNKNLNFKLHFTEREHFKHYGIEEENNNNNNNKNNNNINYNNANNNNNDSDNYSHENYDYDYYYNGDHYMGDHQNFYSTTISTIRNRNNNSNNNIFNYNNKFKQTLYYKFKK
ncbi:hypothetical protein ACTFIU_006168 [Dictyostelium citrinum]